MRQRGIRPAAAQFTPFIDGGGAALQADGEGTEKTSICKGVWLKKTRELNSPDGQALSVAPASKLLYSSDGIHVPEIHWAAAIRGRSIPGQALDEMVEADEIDEEQAYLLARQVLHDTVYTVYRL